MGRLLLTFFRLTSCVVDLAGEGEALNPISIHLKPL